MSMRYPLIDHLESLVEREDRSALASLRRGLGHDFGVVEMYPHVVPFIPEDDRNHRFYFLVAALFAVHPDGPVKEGETIGHAFARIGLEGGNLESVERRFTALLGAHVDEVGDHLRHAVSLARSKGVGIDYRRLLRDLHGWSHPERFVQLQWARDFWRASSTDTNNAAAEAPSKGDSNSE